MAVFIVGIYLLLRSSKETVIPKEIENEVTQLTLVVDKSLVTDINYTIPTKYTTFDVFYPQFKNASSLFNEKIEDLVMGEIANHSKISEENWKGRYNTRAPGEKISEFPPNDEKYSLSISWVPIQLNKNFISGLLVFSGYVGGAHGYENVISLNYNVKNQKKITLADLFPDDPQYLKTISEFARKDLRLQFGKNVEEDMLLAGTTPEQINFNVFTFTDDKITFYFNQYQVAPYAMGQSSVSMPRN